MARISRDPDVMGGEPCIEGRRVSVRQIVEMVLDADRSPEYVADQLDLDLSDVHSALAYYYDHPEEMEAVKERRREQLEQIKRQSTNPAVQ